MKIFDLIPFILFLPRRLLHFIDCLQSIKMNFLKPSQKHVEVYNSVSEGLKRIYKNKLLPLEETYLFHEFHSPLLDDADFDAKPMILLVGQYSTGKTTFINYLLEKEFPGECPDSREPREREKSCQISNLTESFRSQL